MKKNLFQTVIIVFILLLCTNPLMAQQGSFNLENEIAKNGRPTLIMLTARWCAPCRVMKKKVMKEPSVIMELSKMNVIFYDVDTPIGKEAEVFFKQYDYDESIPYFALFDSQRQFKASASSLNTDDFLKFLNKVDLSSISTTQQKKLSKELISKADPNIANAKNYSMVCFSTPTQFEFLNFCDSLNSSPNLQKVASLYSLRVVDPVTYSYYDYNADSPIIASKKKSKIDYKSYSLYYDNLPAFLLFDSKGRIFASISGFSSEKRFLDLIKEVEKNEELYKNLYKKYKRKTKRNERFDKLVHSLWRIDLEADVNLSFFSTNVASENKARVGYGVSLIGRRYFSDLSNLNSFGLGLSYNSWGGGIGYGTRVREDMIKIPIDMEFKLSRVNLTKSLCSALLYFRFGGWGSYSFNRSVSHSTTLPYCTKDHIRRWDSGVMAGLTLQQGSFYTKLTYSRGLFNRIKHMPGDKAFYNVFSLSFGIRYGD